MMDYVHRLVVATSILINATLGGDMAQTLSCRAAIAQRNGKKWGCVLCKLLDTLHKDHCFSALLFWEHYRASSRDFRAHKSTGEVQGERRNDF